MRVLVLSVLAACGRFGFDASPTHGNDAADTTDASPGDGPSDSSDAPQDTIGLVCAASYTQSFGTSKYRVGNATTWLAAEQACQADGAGMHLAVIADFNEQQKIESFTTGQPVWVGLSDRKIDMQFLLVIGGVAQYHMWKPGDPSFAGPGCVSLDPVARTFHDEDCTDSHGYVCECDLIIADDTSY